MNHTKNIYIYIKNEFNVYKVNYRFDNFLINVKR